MADAVDSVLASIDSFVASINKTPEGGARPPIAIATLQELLHKADGTPDAFTHVLLIKAEAGQAQQLLENKPLWWEDKFSSVVDVSVTYMLIKAEGSGVEAAGTATGTASAFGKIGETPQIAIHGPTNSSAADRAPYVDDPPDNKHPRRHWYTIFRTAGPS